jgi:hypothetical protein
MKEALEPLEKFYSEYLKEWRGQIVKPCNEESFIQFFKNLLMITDESDIEFHRNNCYDGKEISIVPNRFYFGSCISLDVVYCKDFLKVFTSEHNGYWTSEFISVNSDSTTFKDIQKILKQLLMKTFGLENF